MKDCIIDTLKTILKRIYFIFSNNYIYIIIIYTNIIYMNIVKSNITMQGNPYKIYILIQHILI